MKVLIWVLGYLVMTLVYALTYGIFANAGRFMQWAEALLYLVVWILVSKALCKKWDKHKVSKDEAQVAQNLSELGMTKEEYIKANVPESYLELCEFYRGKPFELEPYLKTLLEDRKISKVAYNILMNEYKK